MEFLLKGLDWSEFLKERVRLVRKFFKRGEIGQKSIRRITVVRCPSELDEISQAVLDEGVTLAVIPSREVELVKIRLEVG